MNIFKRLLVTMTLGLAGLAMVAPAAQAQTYPPVFPPPSQTQTFAQGQSGADLLALIRANAAAAAKASAEAAAKPAVGVPVGSVPAAPVNLAFTGGDINLPIALGAALVGAGGLALLGANKRSRRQQ